jgi:integrase
VPLQLARERARAVERAIAAGATDRTRLRAIARGTDPNRQPARPIDTVEAVAAEFITRYLRAQRRSSGYIAGVTGRLANHVLPTLGPRDIRGIGRRELIDLLDRVHDRSGPGAANQTLAALRKLFRWARQRGLVDMVPTEDIPMPGAAIKRERVLDDRELALIMRAARRLGHPNGVFVQLLMLTAMRRNEVATLRWEDMDIGTGVITLPASVTKARKAHVVPLAPAVMDLLTHCPREGAFVLGATPVVSFSRVKRQLDRLALEITGAPVAPWRLHDLRRSCATSMARLGVTRFIVARVLAHTDGEITGTYDRYEYLVEKRAALERWAAHVVGLLQPQPVEVAHGR